MTPRNPTSPAHRYPYPTIPNLLPHQPLDIPIPPSLNFYLTIPWPPAPPTSWTPPTPPINPYHYLDPPYTYHSLSPHPTSQSSYVYPNTHRPPPRTLPTPPLIPTNFPHRPPPSLDPHPPPCRIPIHRLDPPPTTIKMAGINSESDVHLQKFIIESFI